MPSAMMLLLNPTMRQLFPEHETDFPALVADAPATTVTPVISEEKLNDHCRLAVWAPPADVRVIGRAIVPPAVPDPDPTASVTLCPKAMTGRPRRARVQTRKLRATCRYRLGGVRGTVGLSLSEYCYKFTRS